MGARCLIWQELLGHILTHAGSGVTHEVDAALQCLVDLATFDASAVGHSACYITGILDYLDGLTVPQARADSNPNAR